jgi:transposase
VTAVSTVKPQVIDDEEHERVHDRVAAAGVAKDAGVVCTRTPHRSRPGARQSAIWTVKARMGTIRALGRQLKNDGIEMVTLESASDYWRIWFFVLEACGLAVQLVNASQAKSLPGRPKTDKLDAQWLARLTEMGLLRASFVPPKAIRDLRDYTRARARLTQERTRCWQRPGKAAGGRAGQAVERGQQADHRVSCTGHGQGDDQRAARPQGAGRPGPHRDEGQARRAGGGPGRHVR